MSTDPRRRQAGWLASMRGSLQLGTRGLWSGFALALLLMIATAGISYLSIDNFISASASLDRTQMAVHDLNDVMSRLKDAETGQRGYLVTGNENFPGPFHSGILEIPSSLAQVRSRLDDSHEKLSSIEDMIDKRLELLQRGIAQKRARATADELQSTMLQGKSYMDVIRARIAGIISAQESQLSEQSQELSGNAAHAKRTIVMGNLLAIVLLGLAFAFLKGQVTERTRAQQSAQAHAAEVSDLYNNAACAYHSVDAAGRLIRVNDTWLKWFGYARDEVIGKMQHKEVMTPASAQRLLAFQRDPASEYKVRGAVTDVEFDYQRRDGSVFTAALSATTGQDPVSGEPLSRTTLFDVTERKRARREARRLHKELQQRSAQLEATNKELESFTYSVSHDLRSPLRAIDGFSRMIEEDYQDSLDEEGRRMLGVVRQNAGQMGRLIDDLLAFSRLGKQALSKAAVDMRQLAGEVAAELQSAQEGAADSVRIGELPQAYGDHMLLRQVWINLIANAIKYSGKNAAPAVNISGRVNATPDGEECEYCVEDNGVGFDMQYYDKLFGVFQRLHAASEYPGTGVGLAIVQRVVTRHGGRVWAEARVNEGAKFFFSLPKGRQEDA